jgi:hypothetical protein
MRFSPKQKSLATGLRYYRDANFTGGTVGHLWDGSGKQLASATFPGGTGWITLNFIEPVLLDSAQEYIASFSNDGGFYCPLYNFFPKDYPLYKAITSHFAWSRNVYPTLHYQQTNYSIEPILQTVVAPTARVDTFFMYVSVDPRGAEDWQRYIDLGISVVFTLPEIGGVAMLPDSNSLYKTIFGSMQPHQLRKDDLDLRLYRFTRTYVINGVSTPVRFTLYKTGAWIREIKNTAGIWQILNY